MAGRKGQEFVGALSTCSISKGGPSLGGEAVRRFLLRIHRQTAKGAIRGAGLSGQKTAGIEKCLQPPPPPPPTSDLFMQTFLFPPPPSPPRTEFREFLPTCPTCPPPEKNDRNCSHFSTPKFHRKICCHPATLHIAG